MARELWLFTTRFPQGISEPFLENELPVVAAHADRVRIFPLLEDEGMRPLPANVEVTRLFTDPYRAAGPLEMLRHARALRELLVWARRSAPTEALWTKHRREVVSRARQAVQRMSTVRRALAAQYDPEHVVLYSYWTADWATVLGLWKATDPRVRFVSRMHGFDLYADRSPDGWPPFRAFQLHHVDRVHVASQAGLDHVTAAHPREAAKFRLARLGTRDHGLAPWSPAPVLRIVSCSNLVELKRVHLLAEALLDVEGPVEWTHFGDGPERERIEAVVRDLPPNVKATMMGAVPNARLIDWYLTHPVDLFVHLSSTEGGVPVALQEAASFGIPLLACDAGGVREIVGDRTGLLLPADPLLRQLAQLLGEHRTSHRNTAVFRAGVRRAWSEGFTAERAFGTFAADLMRP